MASNDEIRETMQVLGRSVRSSLSAQKAAETRRANRDRERIKRYAEIFLVLNGQEYVTSFDVGRRDIPPDSPPADGGDQWAADELMPATLPNVVAYIVKDFHGVDGEGYEGMDLAIWNDSRIVAVIRRGPDGEPIATIF